jgi:hypothetical protein
VDINVLLKATDQRCSDQAHPLWRRYCYILLMAAWMGGFTFYALIVIPTAERVLDSMRDTGFITQQVTRWLNLIGASEAHIRGDLQRASNEANGQKTKRKCSCYSE